METGVLERIREFEADIEKHLDSIVQQDIFRDEITNACHLILLDHFRLQQAEKIKNISDKLLDIYLDEDDVVEAQEAPSEGADVQAAALKEFEGKIADVREYHHTYRDLPYVRNELELPDPKMLDHIFVPREYKGSCMDLEPHYYHYNTFMVATSALAAECERGSTSGYLAKTVTRWSGGGSLWEGRVEFFRFIPELPQVIIGGINAHRKVIGFQLYRRFVEELLRYLKDYYTRVHPLRHDLQRLITETESNGEEFWSALVDAKQLVTTTSSFAGDGGDAAGAVGEVALPGRAAHANAKVAGGVVVPPQLRRFAKSFNVWPVADVERVLQALSGHAEDANPSSADATIAQLPKTLTEVKTVCFAEATIAVLLQSLLFEPLQRTERQLLGNYSKTAEEQEQERARMEEDFLQSLADVQKKLAHSVEGTVANAAQYHVQADLEPEENADPKALEELDGPRNEIIGEDGNPIARWLVQLQQLDKSFVCDVCGGTVYKGPKIFREHFGAERHAEGLRRLGITQNLKEYEGISSIRKVIEMRDHLSGNGSNLRRRIREDHESEEMQDAQGKVVTIKDYMRFQKRRV